MLPQTAATTLTDYSDIYSAENMINSVLQSNKVQKVDLATTVRNVPQIQMLQGDGTIVQINVPWYNQGGVMGRFYYWMAAELEYDITVTMVVSTYFAC